VKFPFSVDLADVWTTRISVASRFWVDTTLTSADHTVGDWKRDDLPVLGIADFGVNNWKYSLLKFSGVHVSWMAGLSPSCDVTFGSWCWSCGWQTSWLDIFVEHDWFLQLEQGDIVVESAGVPLWVADDFLNLMVNLGSFISASVPFSYTDLEYPWLVLAPVDAVGSCHDPLVRDEGTSTTGTSVVQHKNLPGPDSPHGVITSNNTWKLDFWVTAIAHWWKSSWCFCGSLSWLGSADAACFRAVASDVGAAFAIADESFTV